MTRPDVFPTWAEQDKVDIISGQNNVVAPDSDYFKFGWLFREKPARNYDNWFKRYVGRWIRHLDSSIYEKVHGMRIGVQAANTIVILPGAARGLGGEKNTIPLPTAFRKTNAVWAAGDSAGGVPAAIFPMVDGTWYHVFVIKRDSDGNVDAGFDTDIDAVNLLAGFSGSIQYRRVGSVYRSGGTFRQFLHDPNSGWFRHAPGVLAATGVSVGQGLHIVSLATGVPPGIRFLNEVNLAIFGAVTTFVAVLSDEELSVQADYGHQVSAAAGELRNLSCLLVTDTLQRVSLSVNAPTTTVDYEIMSCGYQDLRFIPPEAWT